MSKRTLAILLALLLMVGTILEVAPAQARRGGSGSGGGSGGVSGDDGRGRGRGQDDVLPEDLSHREGRRGRHHLQGEDHPRRRSHRSRMRVLQDNSSDQGSSRGRGIDDSLERGRGRGQDDR